MMKIAVICAPQTFGANTGMLSVDLAAWYVLQKHFPLATVRFFSLYPHRGGLGDIPFVYESRADFHEWKKECNAILYWGDFLHGLAYRNAVTTWLMKLEAGLSEPAAEQITRQFLYSPDADTAGMQKIILYGGTILFNPWGVYSDQGYADDLCRLFRQARAVWMREPFSAAAVQYWRGDYQRLAQGTDCALLLNRSALLAIAPDNSDFLPSTASSRKKRIGFFLGRSHLNVEQVVALLFELERQSGSECVWLDWGKPPFFFDKQDEYCKWLPEMAVQPSTGEPLPALTALMSFDLVVSDTYHVCVNAWNLGIPAICLIDNVGKPLGVNNGGGVGRDKRIVFYWSYNLSPFLVYASELTDAGKVQGRAADLIQVLDDAPGLALAMDALQQHASACEKQLVSTLLEMGA